METGTDRLDQVRALGKARGADAVLLTALPDVRWACGFTGSNGLLLVLPDAAHFVTDGRYRDQAAREIRGAAVHVPGYRLFEHVEEAGLLPAAGKVLFQADHATAAVHQDLRDRFPGVRWEGASNLLAEAVARKAAWEVDAIRRAQAITEAVFQDLLGLLRPGLREHEVAAEIVYGHLRRGAQRMSFDPIVASGPNAALPHARPTDRVLQSGELLLLDFGCVVDGYASDMTRTVALGEVGAAARAVYGIVREAQEAALSAARGGMAARELDAVARNVITEAGYGEAFSHGLGHGVGLQTHEWPRVSYLSDDLLPEQAVVTLEPGIYLPGRLGVRIEDMVVLRADGCENLTGAPKDLLVL